jgi:uncharacterized membrane protein YcaP (DUF421 family)
LYSAKNVDGFDESREVTVDWLIGADWHKMFALDTPVLEIILRGTVVYLSLFVFLRYVVKREVGTVGIADLLVIVVIADAAQNAMAGDYVSITDGILLVGTIIFWNYALDWLSFHSPRLRVVIEPQPLHLVKNGRVLRRNLRRALVTDDDLMSQLRLQGIDDVSDVKLACMESDGRISVVEREKDGKRHDPVEREAG